MKKKDSLFVAMASVMLATSCSTDDLQSGGAWSGMAIVPHTSVGKVLSRASETTTANLTSFKAFSFLTDDNKNYMDGVTYSNASGEWTTDAGTFYWPVTGDLNFYSYAPENPGSEGEVKVDPTEQKITGFVPYTTAATQQDFIYSKATGNLASNGTTGIDLNFEHALSEITVYAKNDNSAYTVEVSGVKLGNITSKGDFTFPTIAGDAASWILGSEKADYTTEWESATTLTSTVSSLHASNTAFMLLPQQLEAVTKAKDGNYIALKVKITMQGGQVIHDGWAYVAVPSRWEMGKHYAYTLDFTSGAGQDEDGNDIISGSDVTLKVNVTPWEEDEYTIPSIISGKLNTKESFNLKLNDKIRIPITVSSDGYWTYNMCGRDLVNMKNMFTGCAITLVALDASKFDTQNVKQMNGVFGDGTNGCQMLTSLDLSSWNTSKVTTMKDMFGACLRLKSLEVSNFDTQNVTDMEGMFRNCQSLISLDLSKWNTSKVTTMNNMFGINSFRYVGCSSLKTLNLSGWDTSNVTDMSGMFRNCESLEVLDVSHFNTSKVTKMNDMFNGCSSLTSLDLSNFDTSNVTDMSRMFGSSNNEYGEKGCASLIQLNLSGWNTNKVRAISGIFRGCSSLTTLDLSGWNLTNLTKKSGMLLGCNALKIIYMVGCDETTINIVKQNIIDAGLSTDIIKTSRD